jgi:predicted flavoprotein YhiN
LISTSGGVSWKELNSDLSLKKFPNIQLCGEMLDWDAPTGGYLLQASIASGFCAGAV